MMNPVHFIGIRQRYWALRHGMPFDNQGYVIQLNDNLFMPLSPGAIQDFQAGAGGELNNNMYALHSSSALVANLFDYWRLYNQLQPIMATLCPHLGICPAQDIHYEVPMPIDWNLPPRGQPRHPHLDVLIEYRDPATMDTRKAVAVESKFRETYGQNQGNFAPIYLDPQNAGIWEGLGPLREIAGQIHDNQVVFQHLKVSQLIKHILGLRSQFGVPNFELLYLWYAVPGPHAVQHAREVREFTRLTQQCRPRVKFRAITHQCFTHSLAGDHRSTHGAYIDYLVERYF